MPLTNMFIGTYHYHASPEQLRVRKDLDGGRYLQLGHNTLRNAEWNQPFGLGLNKQNISAMSWASAHTSKQPIPPGATGLSHQVLGTGSSGNGV